MAHKRTSKRRRSAGGLFGAIASVLGDCLAAITTLTLLSEPAAAQQLGRIFPYSWASPIPADDITTADVQHALIWTGHYGAMVDGMFGGFIKRAINGWLTSKGYPASVSLTRNQAVELMTEAIAKRDQYGWAILTDDAIGFSVGVPTKLNEGTAPVWENGALWYRFFGPVGEFITVISQDAGCAIMDGFYDAVAAGTGARDRTVDYKARKDDWFVLSGRSGDRHFYTRAQCRQSGIVNVVINTPTSQVDSFGFLFTAMTNSLSLKPYLNPRAKPNPRVAFPGPPPGYASSFSAPPQASSPPTAPSSRVTPTAASDTERSGKTGGIRLVLSDGTELRAREVFERASEAVYIVHTPNALGSAVAVSDRELVTNCHVLGTDTVAILEREGARLPATLTSANPESDRCILRSNSPLRKWVRIRPFADIKVAEKAYSIGAPQGLELTIAEGIISSKRTIDGERLLQTSAPISKGSSGGGLFDAQGNLLGVTTFFRKDAQNLNFAIAAEEYAK
ncbi:trypsin-like peptidase domain-containing protein [Reyranella sp.]|uniref:S1 family peptidase n=1 Tax=Reyranella sp. TaxID=1929291 RepID=UPI003D0ED609